MAYKLRLAITELCDMVKRPSYFEVWKFKIRSRLRGCLINADENRRDLYRVGSMTNIRWFGWRLQKAVAVIALVGVCGFEAGAQDNSYTVRVRTSGIVGLKDLGGSILLLVGDFRQPSTWPINETHHVVPHFATLSIKDANFVSGGPSANSIASVCHLAGFWRSFDLEGYDLKIVSTPPSTVHFNRGARVEPKPCHPNTLSCSAIQPYFKQINDLGWLPETSQLLRVSHGTPFQKLLNHAYLDSPCSACAGRIAARLEILGGFVGTKLWTMGRDFDLIRFSDNARPEQALAERIEFIFRHTGMLKITFAPYGTGAAPSPLLLEATPGSLMDIVIANNPRPCIPAGRSDFRLHYNLINKPDVLDKLPYPEIVGATDAQCSPVEYRP